MQVQKRKRRQGAVTVKIRKRSRSSTPVFHCDGVATFKDIKRIFGMCDVACLDRQRRLWLVPVVKDDVSGYSVLKTSYIGAVPREIGFAPTKESAIDYFYQHNRIPPKAWKKCPVFSMMNVARDIV